MEFRMTDRETMLKLLLEIRKGEIDPQQAVETLLIERDLGHTLIDQQRAVRTGLPEVVYGEGKTAEQIANILTAIAENEGGALATRVSPEKAEIIAELVQGVQYHPVSRLLSLGTPPKTISTRKVMILSAGTSDLAVAQEATTCAEWFGLTANMMNDVGVAGLHRLVARMDALREAAVIIVVAGMEGALPAVVAGMVKAPVIAVPTSVGYGANLEGLTTLLAMVNSCAAGVSVVNIDNGFGAAVVAHRIIAGVT